MPLLILDVVSVDVIAATCLLLLTLLLILAALNAVMTFATHSCERRCCCNLLL